MDSDELIIHKNIFLLYIKKLSVFVFIFQEESTGDIIFFMKGADVVMSSIVQYNDWLDEEVSKEKKIYLQYGTFF